MNRFLADALKAANGLAALLVIVVATLAGAGSSGRMNISTIAGGVMGLLIGTVISVLVFGALALIIDMRSELIRIRTALEARRD
jgi:hypothetical protein